ncbi:MAG: hypothetical protein ACM3Q2_04295 [Syntrophothermus sp.]
MVALFVLFTFALFVVIDIIVLKAQRKKHPAFAESTQAVFNRKTLSLPERIFVSKGHTWAELMQDGLAKVGVDEFVLKALGKVTVSNMVAVQTSVKRGDVLFEGTAGKGHFAFRSPIDGTVKQVNKNLRVVDDPYNNDWGVMIAPSSWERNIKDLKNGHTLVNWLKDEFSRLKDFLAVSSMNTELAGVTMHDGGNIVEGAVTYIREDGLKKFENEFLSI